MPVDSPRVDVITPVYNGEDYLAECIESVLAQTYSNWTLTIVNNCSTDNSLALAEKYAARDHRIRVVNNERFLRIIENHNHAVRQLSQEAKYCKILFADDWLYPTCLEEMVRLAEEYPTVGIVGAYATDGEKVLWPGPPQQARRTSGWEICRRKLLGRGYVFGTMTTLLLRADLIRKRAVFFNEHNLHADYESCCDLLQESDFGYVHQVLSFSRPPDGSASTFAEKFDSIILGELVVLHEYGPVFLEENELRQRLEWANSYYHRILAKNVLRLRSKDFWEYHRKGLSSIGVGIDKTLLVKGLLLEVASEAAHPGHALKVGWTWWCQALSRLLRRHPLPAQRMP